MKVLALDTHGCIKVRLENEWANISYLWLPLGVGSLICVYAFSLPNLSCWLWLSYLTIAWLLVDCECSSCSTLPYLTWWLRLLFFYFALLWLFVYNFVRLQGEPVNLREQHDALEFFNSLVDGLDEALKSLGYVPILTRVLGGSFADQKICKDCPHR